MSWQRYCTALQYWTSAKLCGVEQRAPPIFGRAAITLGIGPNSKFCYISLIVLLSGTVRVIRVTVQHGLVLLFCVSFHDKMACLVFHEFHEKQAKCFAYILLNFHDK